MANYNPNYRPSINSVASRRIVDALWANLEPMTLEEIAEAAFISLGTVKSNGRMRMIQEAGLAHIAKWQRQINHGGAPSPLWVAGPGENAERPKPYSDAQKSKRWKKKANYSERQNISKIMGHDKVLRDPILSALMEPKCQL